jgi:hypothetical protein
MTNDLDDFYALRLGAAPLPDGRQVKITVVDLGVLRVPSGRLGASDPFVNLDEPLVIPVPPGDYPVRVTVADVSPEQDGSHLREAYLSVVLSEQAAVILVPARGVNGPPSEGRVFSVPVDAGTVAFADADAVTRCMPSSDWYDTVFDSGTADSWFSVMDSASPLPSGTANVIMPGATEGENVVLSHSGWGDDLYPVLETRDAAGQITGVHIDLLVVGRFEDDEAPEPAQSAPTRGWLSRLFRRSHR